MSILIDDPSIPRVGQQFAVDGYTIAIAARCQCAEAGSFVPLTVTCSTGGTSAPPNSCPKCHLGYAVEDVKMDSHGRLTFAVAVLSSQTTES